MEQQQPHLLSLSFQSTHLCVGLSSTKMEGPWEGVRPMSTITYPVVFEYLVLYGWREKRTVPVTNTVPLLPEAHPLVLLMLFLSATALLPPDACSRAPCPQQGIIRLLCQWDIFLLVCIHAKIFIIFKTRSRGKAIPTSPAYVPSCADASFIARLLKRIFCTYCLCCFMHQK